MVCLVVLARVETPLEGLVVELSVIGTKRPLSKFTSVAVWARVSANNLGDILGALPPNVLSLKYAIFSFSSVKN
jgi:hypothetical protein